MQQSIIGLREGLSRSWGWIALRGIIGIIFGIMAFIWPIATIWALALLWGAFAFAEGILTIGAGWNMHKEGVRWWPYLLFGVIGIIAGIVTFVSPGITALALIFVIGFTSILGGVSEIVAAIRLRKEIEGEWALILAGIVSVLFGLLVLMSPITGMIVTAWLVGAYAVIIGIIFLVLALRVRKPMRASGSAY